MVELRAHEREGVDFSITVVWRTAPIAIIAPHGGKIEAATSDIASAIAADDFSLYRFNGIKRGNNQVLHVTSTNFDDSQCLDLIGRCDVVVAIHGLKGQKHTVDVGGRDEALRNRVVNALNGADFVATVVTTGDHAAVSPRNICNRGRSGAGIQLEITRGLRDALGTEPDLLKKFVTAVRGAIRSGL